MSAKKKSGKKKAKKKAAAEEQPSSRVALWWRNLGKGAKGAVVAVSSVVVAAVIPGTVPWVTDRASDVFGQAPFAARGEARPQLMAGQYWATGVVLTEPVSIAVLTAVEANGAQLGTSGHEITLDSNRSARIDLESITAVIEQRKPPLAGTAFIADPQGAGDVAQIAFHLDSGAGQEVPALVPPPRGDDESAPQEPYLAAGEVRYLERGKPEHLVISASTSSCYCLWRVHIRYSYRGSFGDVIVPPVGEPPFATTAWAPHAVEYNLNTAKEGSTPQRIDCKADPKACRTKH